MSDERSKEGIGSTDLFAFLSRNYRAIMKPKPHHGNNPKQYSPCNAVLTQRKESIKRHPAVLAIRNKRKRMKLVKDYAKLGITFFVRPVWEIYPANDQ